MSKKARQTIIIPEEKELFVIRNISEKYSLPGNYLSSYKKGRQTIILTGLKINRLRITMVGGDCALIALPNTF